MVFPLLFDLCNSEPLKSGQAPLVSDPAETGYDKFWIFIYILQHVYESFNAVLEVKFLMPSWFSLMLLIKEIVKRIVSCMILNRFFPRFFI